VLKELATWLSNENPPWLTEGAQLAVVGKHSNPESKSTALGLARAVVGGWTALPVYETLVQIPRGHRALVAWGLFSLTGLLQGNSVSSEYGRQAVAARVHWSSAAVALTNTDALTDHKLAEVFHAGEDLIQAACMYTNPRECLASSMGIHDAMGTAVAAMKSFAVQDKEVVNRAQLDEAVRRDVEASEC
jgi:hypothetical protein